MGLNKYTNQESAFDINLAPFLDIIVSVVPMLLLSFAFMQIKMIETPVPQVVTEASQEAQKQKEVEITLRASKAEGYVFEINEAGKVRNVKVGLLNGALDPQGLYRSALEIKRQHPHVLNVSLNPSGDVPLEQLVAAMDSIRKLNSTDGMVSFRDPASSKMIETDFLFPNVTFGNVVGE